jgi:hypothetical protein
LRDVWRILRYYVGDFKDLSWRQHVASASPVEMKSMTCRWLTHDSAGSAWQFLMFVVQQK